MHAENYFCLSSDGLLYYLGKFEDEDDAMDQAIDQGLDVVWMIDEQTANSWRTSLTHVIK